MDDRNEARRQVQKDCGVEIVSIWDVNSAGKVGYLRFLNGEPIPYGYMLAIREARSEILSDCPRATKREKQRMVDSIHANFKVRKMSRKDRPLRDNETVRHFLT